MTVFEAVDSRISCRWFLDKPAAPEIVRALIVRAARGLRRQSAALAVYALAEIKRQVALGVDGRDPRHDEAEYPIYPRTLWGQSRREASRRAAPRRGLGWPYHRSGALDAARAHRRPESLGPRPIVVD